MIPAALCLLTIYFVLFVAGLIMLARAAKQAPNGFEDARGFHVISPTQEAGAKAQTPPAAQPPVRELLHVAWQ